MFASQSVLLLQLCSSAGRTDYRQGDLRSSRGQRLMEGGIESGTGMGVVAQSEGTGMNDGTGCLGTRLSQVGLRGLWALGYDKAAGG